jgi:hypothetical protein
MRKVLLVGVISALYLFGAASAFPTTSAVAAPRSSSVTTASSPRAHAPVLAYFYIWFDKASWRRAKTDYPLIGRYSSDDASVMREQVRLAKRAGIEGFIVSWKHTPTLDRRLGQLIDIAEHEQFKLAIIYQGLDFHRRPLPADTVARDLAFFATTFAARAPFKIFAKPVVIWSGTWEFGTDAIERATRPVRGSLAVLGSEKNLTGYHRIASAVDGDAYYWSSVNPATYKGYIEKLTDLGEAVHTDNGLWIAPAAVGFDARKVGGTTVVPRAGGATLLTQIDAALASAPDALGLISWNEFSENSHLEPSREYGYRALDVVSDRLGTGATIGSSRVHAEPVARSATAPRRRSPSPPIGPSATVTLAIFVVLGALVVFVGVRRARNTPRLRVVGMSVPTRGPDVSGTTVRGRSRQEIVAARRKPARTRRHGRVR